MEYNTTRPKMIIPEYGRNVQKMIEYALTIEDRERRTRAARQIVNVMGQIHPQQKDMGDFKRKLWDHLFIISGFRLDVDSPFPPPEPETLVVKPERISYPSNDLTYAHYGKNIENIIEKAVEYPEGPEKQALVHIIANHMKKSYLTWNRDSVSDELIYEHLNVLSKGRLKLEEDARLHNTSDILGRNKKKKFSPRNGNTNQPQPYSNGNVNSFNGAGSNKKRKRPKI